jgi:hypothetical protein
MLFCRTVNGNWQDKKKKKKMLTQMDLVYEKSSVFSPVPHSLTIHHTNVQSKPSGDLLLFVCFCFLHGTVRDSFVTCQYLGLTMITVLWLYKQHVIDVALKQRICLLSCSRTGSPKLFKSCAPTVQTLTTPLVVNPNTTSSEEQKSRGINFKKSSGKIASEPFGTFHTLPPCWT